MAALARNNHFVPQSYTSGWAVGGKVWCYHLLAPSAAVPLWEEMPVKRYGRFRDLYTTVQGGSDSDDNERWLNDEVEAPAAEPMRKLRANHSLSRDEWRRLTRYVVALRYRTVANYHEQIAKWTESLPAVLNETLKGSERRLRKASRNISKVEPTDMRPAMLGPRVDVTIEPSPAPGKSIIHASVRLDRELWLYHLRRVLTELYVKLPDYSWSVVHPWRGGSWFTSDHPVFLLRYTDADKYDFEGAWKQKRVDIIVPMSPYHLLHASVGADLPPIQELTGERTIQFQRMIAENAFRSIVAASPTARPTLMRPRLVDLEAYRREQDLRLTWHDEQRRTTGE